MRKKLYFEKKNIFGMKVIKSGIQNLFRTNTAFWRDLGHFWSFAYPTNIGNVRRDEIYDLDH